MREFRGSIRGDAVVAPSDRIVPSNAFFLEVSEFFLPAVRNRGLFVGRLREGGVERMTAGGVLMHSPRK